MPNVDSVDYAAKRIYLHSDTTDQDLDTIFVYKEVRALRRTNTDHRKYPAMIEAGGNIKEREGVFTPNYVRLLNGCRIVPFNVSHGLRLIRKTFTDDNFAGRDCFDRTTLSPSVAVDIDVDIQEVEIRDSPQDGVNAEIAATLAAINSKIGTPASDVSTDIAAVKDDTQLIKQDQGLDASNPKTITEIVEGASYDESFNGVTKEIRRSGNSTTLTRTA